MNSILEIIKKDGLIIGLLTLGGNLFYFVYKSAYLYYFGISYHFVDFNLQNLIEVVFISIVLGLFFFLLARFAKNTKSFKLLIFRLKYIIIGAFFAFVFILPPFLLILFLKGDTTNIFVGLLSLAQVISIPVFWIIVVMLTFQILYKFISSFKWGKISRKNIFESEKIFTVIATIIALALGLGELQASTSNSFYTVNYGGKKLVVIDYYKDELITLPYDQAHNTLKPEIYLIDSSKLSENIIPLNLERIGPFKSIKQ